MEQGSEQHSEEMATESVIRPQPSISLGWCWLLALLFIATFARWIAVTPSHSVSGTQDQPLSTPIYMVDVNAASVSELRALPEIGPTLAQRIVEHRENIGKFQSVDELEFVHGFGPRTLEQVRHLLSINPESAVPQSVATR